MANSVFDNFAIFILSHENPEGVKTLRTIQKTTYDGNGISSWMMKTNA